MSRPVSLLLAVVAAAFVAPASASAVQPPAPAPDLSAPLIRADPTPPTTLPTVWGCHPDRTPNPCLDEPGDTTVLRSPQLQPRKVDRIDPAPDRSVTPPVDCFYVYPTVTTASGNNAPRVMERGVEAIFQSQAAAFSGVCRVFAPIYRQVTSIPSIGLSMATGQTRTSPAQNVAFSDLLGAFRDYMAHDNHGRGIVLIGHSQGSALLLRLIERDVDRTAQTRAKLVSAMLMGGNVAVKRGQRNGGSFAYIPTCVEPGEYGCVVAYSAFGGSPPGGTALFGRLGPLNKAFGGPYGSAYEVVCTDPTKLSGDDGLLRPIVHSKLMPGGEGDTDREFWNYLRPTASTTWVVPGGRFTARCRNTPTTAALMVRPGQGNLMPAAVPWSDWGLHAREMSLTLGNLVRVVELQSAAWLADQPS